MQSESEIIGTLKRYFPVDWQIQQRLDRRVVVTASSYDKSFSLRAEGIVIGGIESWMVEILGGSSPSRVILARSENIQGISLEQASIDARRLFEKYLAEAKSLIGEVESKIS